MPIEIASTLAVITSLKMGPVRYSDVFAATAGWKQNVLRKFATITGDAWIPQYPVVHVIRVARRSKAFWGSHTVLVYLPVT